MPQLRNYQEVNLTEIRQAAREGCKRILFVGVTAYGKTNLFSKLALDAFAKGRSLWVLTHRWTLFENTLETMAKWGVPCGAFDSERPHDGQPIQVVMKDTLAARLKKGWMPARKPDILIMDEADLCGTPTWQAAVKAFPDAFVIGFTGTPEDGKGGGLGKFFDRMILGPSPKEMMDMGYIARARYMSFAYGEQVNIRGMTTEDEITRALELSKPGIVGDAVTHYLTHGQEVPFLCSAINIQHAERFAEAWSKEGTKCEVIHSKLPDKLQRALFYDLKYKQIKGLSSVDMIGRGTDVPSVKYLACCRPTNSLRWWLQWLGRGVRWDNGLVLTVADHVGNLWRHGTIEMARKFTLEGVSRKDRAKEVLAAVCQCPGCFVHLPKFVGPCPNCGHVAEVKARKLKTVKGELKELTASEIDANAQRLAERQKQGMAKTESELVKQFMAKGSSLSKATYRARMILRARRMQNYGQKNEFVDRRKAVIGKGL